LIDRTRGPPCLPSRYRRWAELIERAVVAHPDQQDFKNNFVLALDNGAQASFNEQAYETVITCLDRICALGMTLTQRQRFELGTSLYHTGEHARAKTVLELVLEEDPNHVGALNNLGNIHREQDWPEKALSLYRRALQREPNSAIITANVGTALREFGRPTAALQYFKEAIKLDPTYAEAFYNRALLYNDQNVMKRAIKDFLATLALNPNHFKARAGLIKAYMQLGRTRSATKEIEGALEIRPDLFELWLYLATAREELGDRDGADIALARAEQQAGGAVEAFIDIFEFHLTRRRFDKAVACLEDFAAHTNMPQPIQQVHKACVELLSGKVEQAFALFEQVLRVPDLTSYIYVNIARSLYFAGFYGVRRAVMLACMASGDVSAKIKMTLGGAEMMLGDFERGWPLYDHGLDVAVHGRGERLDEVVPRWDGVPLPNGQLLWVVGEQGAGDEIMFGTVLPEVLATGQRVIYSGDPRIAGIFNRNFDGLRAVPRPADHKVFVKHWDIGAHCHIGTLTGMYRPTLDSFDQQSISYLKPANYLSISIRSRLPDRAGRLRVGIGWFGGNRASRRLRSVTLDHWEPILSVPGVQFVSIQYGEAQQDVEVTRQLFGVEVHVDPKIEPLDDLEGSMALINEMDLVISVSNTGVHTAGALGVPCWTLIPVACDWRWVLPCEHAVWYPNVKLFRQTTPFDWTQTIRSVGADLRRVVDGALTLPRRS
jgi:tetratricopeptide (TPR) repeat protein